MLVNIHGAKCVGIEAVPVTIEVDITLGVGIHLTGLADAAVKEKRVVDAARLFNDGKRCRICAGVHFRHDGRENSESSLFGCREGVCVIFQ